MDGNALVLPEKDTLAVGLGVEDEVPVKVSVPDADGEVDPPEVGLDEPDTVAVSD